MLESLIVLIGIQVDFNQKDTNQTLIIKSIKHSNPDNQKVSIMIIRIIIHMIRIHIRVLYLFFKRNFAKCSLI